MGNPRKRRKGNASPTTSISSSPAPAKRPSRKKHNATVIIDNESEKEPQATDCDRETPGSTQILLKGNDLSDKEELCK
jgi:hypothetical protein